MSEQDAEFKSAEVPGTSRSKMDRFEKKLWKFNKDQTLLLILFGVNSIFRAVSIVTIGPFYPQQAEKKGAGATEVGFVIGSFDMTVCFFALFFVHHILARFGPWAIFKMSVLSSGIFAVFFGFVVFIGNYYVFLTCCFIIRILSGAMDSCFYPAIFCVFADHFSDSVATVIGILELLFGFGAILAPTVIGAIINMAPENGYTFAYVGLGVILMLCSIFNHLIIGQVSVAKHRPNHIPKHTFSTLVQYLICPGVFIPFFCLFVTAASIGFIFATLDFHLQQFNLSSFQTGLMFTLMNLSYTISSPLWGYISDKLKSPRNIISFTFSSIFIILGYSLIGPLPFLPIETKIWMIITGLLIQSLGMGGAIMASFPQALRSSVETLNHPDDLGTHSKLSSLYAATFAFGNTIGPFVAGYAYDTIGFRFGSLIIIGLAFLSAVSSFVLFIRRWRSTVLPATSYHQQNH